MAISVKTNSSGINVNVTKGATVESISSALNQVTNIKVSVEDSLSQTINKASEASLSALSALSSANNSSVSASSSQAYAQDAANLLSALSNVDNTSDLDKPVSNATQTALNLKANLASPTFTGTVSGISKSMVGLANVDNTSDALKPVSTAAQTALNLKANLASPTFTGTVSGITKAMVGLANVDNTADSAKVVASAAKLTTARTINGELFDGTADIMVATKKVDMLYSLRTITEAYETVWVSGYHTKNDGAFGSHIFRLKGVKTTETDNGGTVIIATIGGVDYVYELQYDGAVNVKWFGAVGDGVTDDTATIQSTINSIPNTAITNSMKLYIPAGSYKITRPLLIHLKDGMQIVGDGKFATKIFSSGLMTPDLTVVAGFPADRVFKDIVYSDKPCFFMVSAMRVTGGVDDGYNINGAYASAWHLAFKDFSLHAEDVSRYTVDGIYAPQIAESVIDNIYMKNVKDGIASCQMYKLDITNYKASFAKSPFNHFSTYTVGAVLNERSNGTSVHLSECGADNCKFGWKFDRLVYSSFNNVAIDSWGRGVTCTTITTPDITPYAYAFTGTCNITMNGCGAEGSSTLTGFSQARGLIYSLGNNIVINGGNYRLGLIGEGFVNASIISQSNVSFNNTYINQSAHTVSVNTESKIFVTAMDKSTPFPSYTGESVYNLFATDSTSYISFIDPFSRPRVYANKTVPQTLPLNGYIPVTFNELIDSSNSFNSDTFTAPYGAVYCVSGCITKSGSGVNYGYLAISGEQAPIVQLDETSTTQETIPFSWVGLLQSGDTVVVAVRTSTTGTPSILDGGYISIVAL